MLRSLRAFLIVVLAGVGLLFGSAALAGPDPVDIPDGPSMSVAPQDPYLLARTERPSMPERWATVNSPWVRVHHAPADEALALDLARHAAVSAPAFADLMKIPVGGIIDVYIADSQERFTAIQPGSPPDWADGTAYPLRGMIFLRSPDIRPGTEEPLTTVLDHELVHVLLGRAFGGQRVPRWLQEGAAQVYARQYTQRTTDVLASGLLGRDLMHLDDLATGFPADPVRARLAYAQSADLVAYLNNEYGPDAIPTLVRELSHGAGFGAAMKSATGDYVEDVDRKWRSRLESSGLWLKPLVSDTMMFSVGAVVLVVGFFGVRRRNKEKLARMEEEDRARDAVARAMGMTPNTYDVDGIWQHPAPTDGPAGPADRPVHDDPDGPAAAPTDVPARTDGPDVEGTNTPDDPLDGYRASPREPWVH